MPEDLPFTVLPPEGRQLAGQNPSGITIRRAVANEVDPFWNNLFTGRYAVGMDRKGTIDAVSVLGLSKGDPSNVVPALALELKTLQIDTARAQLSNLVKSVEEQLRDAGLGDAFSVGFVNVLDAGKDNSVFGKKGHHLKISANRDHQLTAAEQTALQMRGLLFQASLPLP